MTLQSQSWFNPSKGEEVLWYSHPSFVMRLPTLLAGVAVALAGIIGCVYIYFFVEQLPDEVAFVCLAFLPIGLVFTGYKMLIFKNTWYVITNRRVIRKTDIVGRTTSSKPHREIVRVDVQVSTLDAIISRLSAEDIGDIVIRTADDTGERFVMDRIPEVSMAESYIERLSGTGPDTPDEYDAEENDRLRHERTTGEEPVENAQSFTQEGYQSPTETTQDQHLGQETHGNGGGPSTEPTTEEEFDDFEPSDKA